MNELKKTRFLCPGCSSEIALAVPNGYFPVGRKIKCHHCQTIFIFNVQILESVEMKTDKDVADFLSDLADRET